MNIENFKERYVNNRYVKISLCALAAILFVVFIVNFFCNIYAYSNDSALANGITTNQWEFTQQNLETVSKSLPIVVDKEGGTAQVVGKDTLADVATLGPNGFTNPTSSLQEDGTYCNYIMFTPKIEGTLNFSYLPYALGHNPKVIVTDNLTSLSNVVVDNQVETLADGTLKTSVLTSNLLVGKNYYIISISDEGYLNGGVVIPSISFAYKINTQEELPPVITDNSPALDTSGSLGASIIGNNGYPYVDLGSASSNSLTIAVDVTDALATFQWQKCSDPTSSPWTNMENANTRTYHFYPENGCWYRCVVNGTLNSKAVQAANCNYWALGNGNVYGTSFGGPGYYCYDVYGRYNEELISSTWSNDGYRIVTSDSPEPESCDYESGGDVDSVMFSFNENAVHTTNLTIKLPDHVKALSVGTDSRLITDEATLAAYLKSNKELSQIQTVGTNTPEIEDDMASFVQNFKNPVSCFWLDHYSSARCFGYNIKNGPSKRWETSTVKTPGSSELTENVVTKYFNDDSGYTMSWLNLQTHTLQALVSLGSVDQTGALKIEVTPVDGHTLEVVNDPEYYYALFDSKGNELSGYQKYSESMEVITYGPGLNLEADTVYQVRASKVSTGDEPVTQDTMTYIDPNYKANHVTPVSVTATGASVIISNAEDTYQYSLNDENGGLVKDYVSPINGRVVFDGLDEQTTYNIVAQSDVNYNSESVPVTTKKTLNASAVSCTQVHVENMTGYEFALFDEFGNVVGDYDWQKYDETEFDYTNLSPDTRYVIQARLGTAEPCIKDALTFIDPTTKLDGTPIEFNVETNSLSLVVTEPTYSYALKNTSGVVVTPYLTPVDGVVEFAGLKKGYQYYLVAASDENPNSEQLALAAWEDYAVQANSSTQITVKNNDSFVYALYTDSGQLVYDWKWYSGESFVFNGLQPNTKYIVKEAKSSNGISLDRFVRTYIDPGMKINLDYVYFDVHKDSLTVSNAENQYQYILYDDQMEVVSDYQYPASGMIYYDNLTPGGLYIVKAKHALNEYSDNLVVILQDTYKSNISGTQGHKTFNWEYNAGDTHTEGSNPEFLEQNLYKNTRISFEGDTAYSTFTSENDFKVTRKFSAVPMPGYVFSNWTINGYTVPDDEGVLVDMPVDVVAVYKHDAVNLTVEPSECVDAFDCVFIENGQVSESLLGAINFDYVWVNGNISFSGTRINFDYNDPATECVATGYIDVAMDDNWTFESFAINGENSTEGKAYPVISGQDIGIAINAAYTPHGAANTKDAANVTLIVFALAGLALACLLGFGVRKVFYKFIIKRCIC